MRSHSFSGSSTVERIAFDEASGTLSIWFQDSGRYDYFEVPEAIYEAFCLAASPGSFFNSAIKGEFDFLPDPGRRRFGPNA